MIRLRHKLLIQSFRILDQMILILTGVGVLYFPKKIESQGWERLWNGTFTLVDVEKMLILGIGWILIFDYFIRYKSDRLVAINTQIKNLIKATSCASLFLLFVFAVFSPKNIEVLNIVIFFIIVTLVGILSRLLLRLTLLSARRSGYNYRFLLIVGVNERACEIAHKLNRKRELGYKIVGFVAESATTLQQWKTRNDESWKILGVLRDLRSILTEERVDEIMVCLPADARFSDISMIVQHARDLGIVVRLMPNFADGNLLRNMYIEEFDDEYVVTLFREQLLMQLLLKRLLDATVSLVVLIALFPLMVVVAILIKLTSPGPVFFSQKRVGMNQRQFKLYKFRSMVADAEERKHELQHLNERDGPAFKIQNDPRTTRIGQFIRKTSIDELPQLFNVLSGEMSLVGPRPPLPEEVKRYEWLFRKRLSVKPGVTCIWQISGRNNVTFDRWMKMDHEYIENWSLWLDLKILLKTIPAVLFSRGAS
jgi:exopolysaccharide biosynthesis polyprenyl glycosylphosphotransferase